MMKELLREWPVAALLLNEEGEVAVAFDEAVSGGDSFREAGRWEEAERAYATAVRLRPLSAPHWVQHGHCLRQLGRLVEAEISYRTGLALGARPAHVIEHARDVMRSLNIPENRYPLRLGSAGAAALPRAARLPTRTLIEQLGALLWGDHTLEPSAIIHLLRTYGTIDEVFADMVDDDRFRRANLDWLSLARAEDI